MKKLIIKTAGITFFICSLNRADAQDVSKKVSLSAWDGMAVAGYVNKGGFVNFGGPTVRFIRKPVAAGFGILPTMRIKEESGTKDAPKNSAIMPTAGFGFTFVYKHLALQVPFYYNPKTATSNGKWNPGLGLGYKF
jgi:hypothetical protein